MKKIVKNKLTQLASFAILALSCSFSYAQSPVYEENPTHLQRIQYSSLSNQSYSLFKTDIDIINKEVFQYFKDKELFGTFILSIHFDNLSKKTISYKYISSTGENKVVHFNSKIINDLSFENVDPTTKIDLVYGTYNYFPKNEFLLNIK